MKLKIFNNSGESKGSIDANDAIFNVELNEKLLAQAVRVQLSNRHAANAKVKDRSEVSGGGKKPWRQKGTGRARAGSNRSPIWRGGGVTFGPTAESNFKLELPKKMRTRAKNMILSQFAKNNQIYTVDTFDKSDRKILLKMLSKLKLDDNKILFVTNNDELSTVKQLRNVAGISTIGANSLNIYSLLNADAIIWSKNTIDNFQKATS